LAGIAGPPNAWVCADWIDVASLRIFDRADFNLVTGFAFWFYGFLRGEVSAYARGAGEKKKL
jgi:hypothetical protein